MAKLPETTDSVKRHRKNWRDVLFPSNMARVVPTAASWTASRMLLRCRTAIAHKPKGTARTSSWTGGAVPVVTCHTKADGRGPKLMKTATSPKARALRCRGGALYARAMSKAAATYGREEAEPAREKTMKEAAAVAAAAANAITPTLRALKMPSTCNTV